MMSRMREGSLSTQPMQMYTDFLRVLDKAEKTQNLTESEKAAIDIQRRDYDARIALYLGKSAMFAGDATGAIDHLKSANLYFRSYKIGASLVLLRLAPGLLPRLYRLRDRWVLG